ncbi:uroporphyrinogen-III synthase [Sporolactobacillus sp. CPB3-1]|uniref:Uroporphyrinogen-III synthase n=1 Tax=Sporolactobacillus mangiferae TaxID=2940498 RepID=A0ABT0MDF4_9BACL|nr:uroporphyrinogen-III synthase [Sporolactobacillus mangiferae]MCL1632898.1 uroporphyrinogen-III synthase [Sporolactobacillus mangiferae]
MTSKTIDHALKGRWVLVTRAVHQSASICERIYAHDGTPVCIPLSSYRALPRAAEENQCWLESVRQADWMIFTSQNGLHFFMNALGGCECLQSVNVAAVGRKTAESLQAYGINADFIPPDYSVQGLVQAFRSGRLEAGKVAVPLGTLSNRSWLAELERLGIQVSSCVIYQTCADSRSRKSLERVLQSGCLSAITFASPSSVRFFTDLLDERQWRDALNQCVLAAIGPTTARALKKMGYPPDAVPGQFTAVDMIDALADYYSKKEGSLKNER